MDLCATFFLIVSNQDYHSKAVQTGPQPERLQSCSARRRLKVLYASALRLPQPFTAGSPAFSSSHLGHPLILRPKFGLWLCLVVMVFVLASCRRRLTPYHITEEQDRSGLSLDCLALGHRGF